MSPRDKVVPEPDAAIHHAQDALNIADVSFDRITKLAAVIRAIRSLVNDDRSTVGALLKVGAYLCDDFLDCADSDREEMSGKFDALKAGKS